MEPRAPEGGFLGFGYARSLQRDLVAHCAGMATLGDAVTYRIGPVVVVQLNHPEAVHDVLVTQHKSFRKPKLLARVLGQWNGGGLVVSEGEAWQRKRRLVQPAFKPSRLAAHAGAVDAHTTRMLEGFPKRGELDVAAELNRLTLRVVADALFGADMESDVDAFVGAVAVLNEIAIRELSSPFVMPLWAPLPSKRRLREAIAVIHGILGRIIRDRRKTGEDRGDLLSALLLAVDEEGGGTMTDEEVRDDAVGLMLGGNETTATGLTWALALLAQNHAEQDALAAEIAAGGDDTDPAWAPPKRAAWAFKEALRLYPPAYIVPREALLDVTIRGTLIPKGATVHMVPFVTQRDARWFDEPERFLPDRFVNEDKWPRGAYFPFGMGPRTCVGRALSLLEAPRVLARVLRRYKLSIPEGAPPIAMEAQVSLHPKGGLRLAIEPR